MKIKELRKDLKEYLKTHNLEKKFNKEIEIIAITNNYK